MKYGKELSIGLGITALVSTGVAVYNYIRFKQIERDFMALVDSVEERENYINELEDHNAYLGSELEQSYDVINEQQAIYMQAVAELRIDRQKAEQRLTEFLKEDKGDEDYSYDIEEGIVEENPELKEKQSSRVESIFETPIKNEEGVGENMLQSPDVKKEYKKYQNVILSPLQKFNKQEVIDFIDEYNLFDMLEEFNINAEFVEQNIDNIRAIMEQLFDFTIDLKQNSFDESILQTIKSRRNEYMGDYAKYMPRHATLAELIMYYIDKMYDDLEMVNAPLLVLWMLTSIGFDVESETDLSDDSLAGDIEEWSNNLSSHTHSSPMTGRFGLFSIEDYTNSMDAFYKEYNYFMTLLLTDK